MTLLCSNNHTKGNPNYRVTIRRNDGLYMQILSDSTFNKVINVQLLTSRTVIFIQLPQV